MSKTANKKNSYRGILLIDKPSGLTSQQVVSRVKRILNIKKAGHTGTLDPLATGMLPICLNEATRFSEHLLSSEKAYHVTAKLGEVTETGDSEGAVLDTQTVPELSQEKLIQLLKSFLGEQMQTAPKYSALKYNGKPLYYWARQGVDVPRKIRQITISQINFISYDAETQTLVFDATVSKGTYIRSLVESIGEQLGCGAHMTALRRLWVKPFTSQPMHALDMEDMAEAILPIDEMLQHYPLVTLAPQQEKRFLRGIKLSSADFPEISGICRIYNSKGHLFGLGQLENQILSTKRLLPTESLLAQIA